MAKMVFEPRNEKYANALMQVIIDAGAKRSDDFGYGYTLETTAGALRIYARPNISCFGATVFARFHDPVRALAVLGQDFNLNPYSGKWNHGFYPDVDDPAHIERMVDTLRRSLARVRLG